MKKRWAVFVLLLLFALASSECIFREESKSGGPFSVVVQSGNPGVISNWSAVTIEFDGEFTFPDHNISVSFNRGWIMVLIKASDDVMNLTAFPLENNTYLIPAYSVDTGLNPGWSHVSLLATLKNGSPVEVDLRWRGAPRRIITLNFNAEVRESGDKYELLPISVSAPPTFRAFGKTYRILLLPPDVPQGPEGTIDISGDYAAFWNNKTLTFPRVNTKTVNGGTLITQHPMAAIYVASDDRAAFFDWVPFPYEELKKG